MTDVVKIARDCRATLAAEIAKLDDFIRMAELLVKYDQRLDRDPALGAVGSATEAGLADHDNDANFIGDAVRARAGVAVTTPPISEVATVQHDDISGGKPPVLGDRVGPPGQPPLGSPEP